MKYCRVAISKIHATQWNVYGAKAFFKGRGLRDVVDLSLRQLAPNGDLRSDFFQVEIDIGNNTIGYYGPVEPIIASATLAYSKQFPLRLGDVFSEDRLEVRLPGPAGDHAAGVLDCALWDALAKRERKSVAEMTAMGARAKSTTCYASMITLDIDGVNTTRIASAVKALNFWGQKWTLPDGPVEGNRGLARNLRRVEKLREAVGEEERIMFDLHRRWSLDYYRKFVELAKDFNITWLEDPFPTDSVGSYLAADNHKTPLCVGERFTSAAAYNPFLDGKKNFVIQHDMAWCGGYTVAKAIKERCATEGLLMILHGRRLLPSFHLAAFAPPGMKMLLEYNPIFEPERQTLMGIKNKLIPNENDGSLNFHSTPRMGLWEL